MSREVIISITGLEKYEDDNTESTKTELVTEGKYYKKGDKYYLSYKETEMTGFDEDTTTTLKIDGNSVAMTRFGLVNTHMVFKEGQKHTGHYETPFGSFTIGVFSDEVEIEMNEDGGDISIQYLLEIDNNTKARHNLKLNVRPA